MSTGKNIGENKSNKEKQRKPKEQIKFLEVFWWFSWVLFTQNTKPYAMNPYEHWKTYRGKLERQRKTMNI